MVDCAPKVVCLPVDLHEHLIDVPPPLGVALHPADPPASYVGREHGTETVPLKPHRLVTDVDSALRQEILDVPKR